MSSDLLDSCFGSESDVSISCTDSPSVCSWDDSSSDGGSSKETACTWKSGSSKETACTCEEEVCTCTWGTRHSSDRETCSFCTCTGESTVCSCGRGTTSRVWTCSDPTEGGDGGRMGALFVGGGTTRISADRLPRLVVSNVSRGIANVMLPADAAPGSLVTVKNIGNAGRTHVHSSGGKIEHYNLCGRRMFGDGPYNVNTQLGSATFASVGSGRWALVAESMGNRIERPL